MVYFYLAVLLKGIYLFLALTLVLSTTFMVRECTSLSRKTVCSELYWTLLTSLVLHTTLSLIRVSSSSLWILNSMVESAPLLLPYHSQWLRYSAVTMYAHALFSRIRRLCFQQITHGMISIM